MSLPNARPNTLDHASAKSAVLAHPDTVSILQDQSERRRLNSYMKSMGIRGGPTNLAIFVEALRRGASISPSRNQGMQLVLGSERHWWNNGGSSLNHQAARRLCHHKEINSRVLRTQGVCAPENALFSAEQADRAWLWAQAILPIVIKPSNASQGRGVHTRIQDRSTFIEAFNEVSNEFGDVLVEEQLDGSEHRIFVVGKKVTAALRQIPANVVGDGHSTISGLIEAKNRTATHPHKSISLGTTEWRTLQGLNLTHDSVPEEGRTVFLRQNTNLSTGGDSIDVSNEITPAEREFVVSAAKCWPGLGCAGFDVMLPRTPGSKEPAVLETNISPGISAHLMPRLGQSQNVASTILDRMFPRSGLFD